MESGVRGFSKKSAGPAQFSNMYGLSPRKAEGFFSYHPQPLPSIFLVYPQKENYQSRCLVKSKPFWACPYVFTLFHEETDAPCRSRRRRWKGVHVQEPTRAVWIWISPIASSTMVISDWNGFSCFRNLLLDRLPLFSASLAWRKNFSSSRLLSGTAFS